MAEMFPLFKNNDNIEEGISDIFITKLSQCNNPHIICVYGDARLGKSTKLNQIINGTTSDNYYSLNGPFKTKLEIHTTQTKGCDFYGPIKVKDLIDRNEIDISELEGFNRNILNDELFFVDTEGLKSIDNVTKTGIAGILTILQVASIKILYMPTLENEKFEEVAKNSKLSNILRLFDNVSETIVLIRDVPINDELFENSDQIYEELKHQKETFLDVVGNFFDKLHTKRAICELLPNYELAKKNHLGYSDAYKLLMRDLISTFLSKIHNNNINGSRLIEIIKELIDIFKQVDDIERMRNTDNALNSILKKTFDSKVNKLYLEIKDKINKFDKNIISLENKNEEIQKYLIDYIKNALKDTWDIYYDSIKSDIDYIIERYRLKLSNTILEASKNIKENIHNGILSILSLHENKEINDFFSRFRFYEEINKNELDNLIKNIINKFCEKYKKEFDCFPSEYKQDIQNYLKKELGNNVNYKFESMPKRENYLINVFEDIKSKISNNFLLSLLKKSKTEIEGNLDLSVLKYKIERYIAQNKIIGTKKEDFKKKLNELYEDIKTKLKERIESIKKDEDIKKFMEDQLKGKTIANAMYLIKPISFQNKVIHMDNNNLVVFDFKNENKQKFNINYESHHRCYYIQNVENGQFLTCDDSTIFFTGKNNNANQQWHIANNDSGGYEIILEKNKKLIQVEENANNGSRVSCQEKKRKPNQSFYFEVTTKTMPPPPPPKNIPVPVPHIVPPPNYFPRPNWHGRYINQVSIMDALASVGFPNDKGYRLRIGQRNGIPGQPFTPAYNTHMLNLMKEGRLIIP